MRFTNILVRDRLFRRFWTWLMAAFALFLTPLGVAGAADVSCQDPEYVRTRPGFPGEFLVIRDKLIKVSGAPAPVPVQSVTTFLSPGDDARIVFRAPASPSGDNKVS